MILIAIAPGVIHSFRSQLCVVSFQHSISSVSFSESFSEYLFTIKDTNF